MNRIVQIFIVFLIASSQAWASFIPTPESECSSIDLRNEFSIKMRNQNGISWCFAHAASDFLQFTYRIPEQISAADIAIHYSGSDVSKLLTFFKKIFSKEARNNPPQTGFIVKAVKRAIESGYCPESVFPSDEWFRVEPKTGKREKIEILNAILSAYSIQTAIHAGKIKDSSELPWFFEFGNLKQNDFFEIAQKTKKRNFLTALRDQVCRGERKAFPYDPVTAQFKITGKRVYQRINAALSSHMPISIDFFSGILEHYDHYPRKIDDLHTVLLYGRKFDPFTHSCVYLMKNSYGADCSRYDPKIKCESGYLWFPEKDLYRSLTSTLSMTRH